VVGSIAAAAVGGLVVECTASKTFEVQVQAFEIPVVVPIAMKKVVFVEVVDGVVAVVNEKLSISDA
jgi:hypothetical protein